MLVQHPTIRTHPLDHVTSHRPTPHHIASPHFITSHILSYLLYQVAVNAAIEKKATDKAKYEQIKSDMNAAKKQADGYRKEVNELLHHPSIISPTPCLI